MEYNEEIDKLKALDFGREATVILFGSIARMDSNSLSDIDIAVVTKDYLPKTTVDNKSKINFSFYTEKKIFQMASEGSLFVKHIINEGVILNGDSQLIEKLRAAFGTLDIDKLRKEVVFSTKYLDISEDEYFVNWKRFNDLILYIYRTFLYVRCHKIGIETFSLEKIASILNEEKILEFISLKYDVTPDFDKFLQIRKSIEESEKIKISNEFESYDALLVNSVAVGKLPEWLGIRLHLDSREVFSYE